MPACISVTGAQVWGYIEDCTFGVEELSLAQEFPSVTESSPYFRFKVGKWQFSFCSIDGAEVTKRWRSQVAP